MKVGMNLFLWTDDPCDPVWLPVYERLKEIGFDGVELPIFRPDVGRFAELGKRLDDLGLERTACTVRTAQDDPISPNASIRERALSESQAVIDCCQAVGARLLCGPLYAALGVFSGMGPTEEEWSRSVAVMQRVADYAAETDVELAFEFLNRFEVYLLNTARDTARFVQAVARPNVGIHYDTFHAHIEEKDPGAAIRDHSAMIRHVHISESDRSTPGTGQVAWQATFDALSASNYDGWLTVEAFGLSLPALAASTRIWRRMYDDEESLARVGHDFIRTEWTRRSA